jgi:hypothetical protein
LAHCQAAPPGEDHDARLAPPSTTTVLVVV